MQNDSLNTHPFIFVRRAAAVAGLACATTLGLSAQQTASSTASNAETAAPATQRVVLPTVHPLDFSDVDGVSYSSSAAPDGDVDTTQVATLDFKGLPSDALQPPPRRRYGNRRYNDSSHNPDGSNKWAFVAGVGAPLPVGNTHKYYSPSWGIQVGGGRNFSKFFGVIAQFDYDNLGLQGSTLQNQYTLYSTIDNVDSFSGLDGNAHVWSFSLNPTINFYSGEGLGAYVVGGVGFYHKVTNFQLPATGAYCDPYYGCYQYTANQTFDHYTSNAPGFNGGLGFTFKPSRFAGERFFVEARYVYMINSQKVGLTAQNVNSSFGLAYTGNNFFPANSNRTSYVPVKIGIRF